MKATVRNILMTKVRNKYQRWCRYVRQEIMERELHDQRTTRVESMFLSNLAASKRSTWIRWREYVHEKKMEDLQAQAEEKQVLQMIRNLLTTTTRRTLFSTSTSIIVFEFDFAFDFFAVSKFI